MPDSDGIIILERRHYMLTGNFVALCMQVLRQVLAGLAYIHSQGIIHRYLTTPYAICFPCQDRYL